MSLHRWGAAILAAGAVTVVGAGAFAAAPSGAGQGPAACVAGGAGGQAHAVWNFKGGNGAQGTGDAGTPPRAVSGGAGKTGTGWQGPGQFPGPVPGVQTGTMPGGQHAPVAGCLPGLMPMQSMLQSVSGYLGLSTQQISADLQSGESLDQIAASISGKSAAGVQTALLDGVQAQLANLVTANKLTGAQEQRILAAVQKRLADIAAQPWTHSAGPAPEAPTSSDGVVSTGA